MSKVITVYNNKGGSGKTLITVNMAASLAVLGNRVLVIDSDSQCNATSYLNLLEAQETIEGVYNLSSPALPVVRTSFHENLFITPGYDGLDVLSSYMFCRGEETYLTLKRYLEPAKDQFDFVIIDTPPLSRSAIGYNALIASDYVLVPVDGDGIGGAQGLRVVQGFISEVLSLKNPKLQNLGIVLNKCTDSWTTREITYQIKEQLRVEDMSSLLFKTRIPTLGRYGKSSINRKPIVFLEPNGIGAKYFNTLAKEVIKKTK
jgi:chromosome partitioning protein